MWINQLRRADRPCIAISLLALLLDAPTTKAQAVNPMDALQFYVGRWSCPERKASDPPLSSTFTFAIESNLMRQWIARPKQGSMQAPYVVNSTFSYDVARHRYVQTEMDSDATWYVSIAEPWQGNTIHWVDVATSTKPISHSCVAIPWEVTARQTDPRGTVLSNMSPARPLYRARFHR
jgi:hypothetical protein